MRGTSIPVNKAMLRPILIAGVEKRMCVANAVFSFPLMAATHLQMPACLLGVAFFCCTHFLLAMVTKQDSHTAMLLHRALRYVRRPYYPAIGHPLRLPAWQIKTVSRP